MDEVDDRALERAPIIERDPAPEAKRARPTSLAIISVAGVLLGAAAAWWWVQSNRGVQAPAAPAQATAPTLAIPAATPRVLPPLDQMDTFLRALFGALSSHPDLARWLATDDLIRQLANAIDRIARGQTPARDFAVLRPTGDFQVVRRGRASTIAPASFDRYDRLAALVQSLDPRAVADVYRTIRQRLDEAYRGLGRSEGDVDTAVMAALQVLIDTPTIGDPIGVVPGQGATYAFADETYERLMPAQKQLLRMGPENARRVQARLREIRDALLSSSS